MKRRGFTAAQLNRNPRRPAGMLLTRCWCARRYDFVLARDVWHGRTFVCGHPACAEPKAVSA